MVLGRWWVRGGVVVVAGVLAVVLGFQTARPRVEALVRQRIEAAATRRGWTARVGEIHLSPRCRLDIDRLVVADGFRWHVEITQATVSPNLSWRGLLGRSASLHLSRATISLPSALRLDVQSSGWAVDAIDGGLRVELAERGQAFGVTASDVGNRLKVDAHAANARLSELVHVIRNGCGVVRLGTVDGDGRLERGGNGPFDVGFKVRTRGLKIAALSADAVAPCPTDPFGGPMDLDAEARGQIDLAAGRARLTRAALSTAGIDASAQFAMEGWPADPQLALDLSVSRLDLARVLAAAGLDLPAQDLGVATLTYHVDGRLSAPESLTVTQHLGFTPPARKLPTIERLKGDFVHHVETSAGSTKAIAVSADSPDFIRLADVPPLFTRTLLVAEDSDYYGHRGIELHELPTALAANLARGTYARGASTIPQQLAKNLFLTKRKTISRKVEEAALALLLDSSLGKSRMLEIYLNVIEWGPGLYGLKPAARHYFGREPSQLTPKQIVFLVSMIPGPIKYQRSFPEGTPTPFFEEMMAALLAKLQLVHALSDDEYQAALVAPLDLQNSALLSPDRP